MKDRLVSISGIALAGRIYCHPSLYPFCGLMVQVEERKSGLAVFRAGHLICDGLKPDSILEVGSESTLYKSIELAIIYLEDGALHSAKRILIEVLMGKDERVGGGTSCVSGSEAASSQYAHPAQREYSGASKGRSFLHHPPSPHDDHIDRNPQQQKRRK